MEQSERKQRDNSFIAEKKASLQKVGEFLKEARLGRNLSVEELSSSLRIGKEQLIALEEGDENLLPEKVFIKAMVRRIAEKLSLDTSFIFEELNEKKNNEPKYTSLIKNKKRKNIKTLKINNPISMIFLSGALGLLTSIIALNYIQRTEENSNLLEINEINLLVNNKNTSIK